MVTDTEVAAGVGVRIGLVGDGLAGRLRRRMPGAIGMDDPAADGGAAVLVWSAAHDETLASGPTSALTVALAGAPSVRHVVLVSSAMVYGAWPNNPIPITEDAPLRPDVDFAHTARLVAAEQEVEAWRCERSDRTATILRPVITMAVDVTDRFAGALAAGMGRRVGAADPPAQFLHFDDLASAVALAADRRLDGVFNVAPDGWVPGERVRALAGGVPRVRLPDRIDEVVTDLRWRLLRGPIPPGLVGYIRWPWLVANDRLREHGWRPSITNEQTYVEGTEAPWWTMVSPKRRQELALGGSAVALLVVLGVLIRSVRRMRRS